MTFPKIELHVHRGVVAVGLGGLEPQYPPEDAAARERLGRIGEDYDWGSLT